MSEPPELPPKSESVHGASFGIRAASHIIDLIIVSIITTPIVGYYMWKFYSQFTLEELATPGTIDPSASMNMIPLWVNIAMNVFFLILLVVLWKVMQATPGKRLFKLKVVNLKTGGEGTTGQLSIRAVAYFLYFLPGVIPWFFLVHGAEPHPNPGSQAAMVQTLQQLMLTTFFMTVLPLVFGFFAIVFHRNNHGWHDLVSGTTVIRAESSPPPLAEA